MSLHNNGSAVETKLPELTIKAFVLGIILAVVLTAANAYLGLFAGITISASIPAAVLSMGILGLFRKSNILENNIVQTAASTAEALASAAIFTLPALVLMGYWKSFHTWEVAKILGLGGIIGVVFTIPLRRVLLKNPDLKFPEGTATALILKAGHRSKSCCESVKGSSGVKVLLFSGILSGIAKLCQQGFNMWSGTIAGGTSIGGAVFGGGIEVAPALISIGYIVGFNVALVFCFGGIITWLVAMPIYSLWHGGFTMANIGTASTIWSEHLRYLGVGGMIVAGLYSIGQLATPIFEGLKISMKAYSGKNSENAVPREEKDIPVKYGLIIIICALIPLILYFFKIVNDIKVDIVLAVALIILAFLFSCVAGYMSGLIGSSTCPVSGIAISCILLVSLLLFAFLGAGSIKGGAAAIVLGAIICSSASIATDNMQDLKAGNILGATPWKQQIMLIVGTLVASFIVAGVLNVLNTAYHIGSTTLPAPQANLMYAVEKGVFNGGLPYKMIAAGAVIIVIFIVIDRILIKKNLGFRVPALAVALGLYLPLEVTGTVLIGGFIAFVVNKFSKRKEGSKNGTLVASGIIAGEAIMGILVAIPIFLSGSGNWWPQINGFHWLGPIIVALTALALFVAGIKKEEDIAE